jgi:hypothetical protein
MSEVTPQTHAAIAETVSSGLPETAWSEVDAHDDGSVYARFQDSNTGIYYFHQPGTPEGFDGHSRVILQSHLTYPITEDRSMRREWIVEGPDHRNPHESYLDGPTGTEASVTMFEANQNGNITRSAHRFSTNPDRTYRALARLAKLMEVNLAR